jgi:serine/threonine-protein kinase RsbT
MEINQLIIKEFEITGGDFSNGGKISTIIKSTLKELGLDHRIIRRVAIACYEAEMNAIMYAYKAVLKLMINESRIKIIVEDRGPGIPDVELAMQEGYSTSTDSMREMGFGAGMGLPNIKKSMDFLEIHTVVGSGTTLEMAIDINNG